MRFSIRWKLFLLIGVPLLLIYVGVVGWALVRLERMQVRRLEATTTRQAAQLAAQLDGRFSALAQVARSTASTLETIEGLGEEQLYELLAAAVQQNELIYGASIAFAPHRFDAARRLVAPYVYRRDEGLARLDIGREAYDYTQEKWEWYSAPARTGQPVWTEPYFDKGAGNILMCTYGMPFFRGGEFAGVATIDVPVEQLRQLVDARELAADKFALVSRTGRFIYYPVHDLIMKETVFGLAEKLGLPQVAALGERMIAGEQGSGHLYMPNNPEPSWICFAPIRSTGWVFIAAVPESEVLAFAREQRRLAVAALVAALLLAGLCIYWVSSQFTRPISRLADAVQELGRGRLDTPPVRVDSYDEIGELGRAFNRMMAELRQYVSALTAETAARQALESELQVGRRIQKSLLPRLFPPYPQRPEFSLHAVNAPAKYVAGDFFDFFLMPDGRLFLVIADVSGKGVPAALLMAVSRTILRNMAHNTTSPAEMVRRTNEVLAEEEMGAMFLTMFVGCYDAETGRLVYANAGHCLPYRLDRNGRVSAFGETTGTIVGAIPGAKYEEQEERLAVGDRIVLYTDGIPEAHNRAGELLGEERFGAMLAQANGQAIETLCQTIIDQVFDYEAGDLSDDVTLLVLQRNE